MQQQQRPTRPRVDPIEMAQREAGEATGEANGTALDGTPPLAELSRLPPEGLRRPAGDAGAQAHRLVDEGLLDLDHEQRDGGADQSALPRGRGQRPDAEWHPAGGGRAPPPRPFHFCRTVKRQRARRVPSNHDRALAGSAVHLEVERRRHGTATDARPRHSPEGDAHARPQEGRRQSDLGRRGTPAGPRGRGPRRFERPAVSADQLHPHGVVLAP